MTTRDQDARFDAAMRQRHAAAVGQVSARVQAQLHQRRHAALAGGPVRRATAAPRFAWPLAASFAAVLAVAIGLELHQPPKATGTATAAADSSLDNALDENPDFYLWLGSSDASTFAME